MNAPDTRSRSRPIDQARLESLVDSELAREEAWRTALAQRGAPPLERYLRLLLAKRLAAELGRTFPRRQSTASTPEGWRWPVPGVEGWPATPVGRRRPLPPFRLRRWLLGGLMAAAFGMALAIGIEPAMRPLVAGIGNANTARAEAALRCGEAILLRDESGRWVGSFPMVDCRAAERPHLTAPFDDEATLALAEAIGTLEGRWAEGPLTLFGNDVVGMAQHAANRLEVWLRSAGRPAISGGSTWTRPGGSGPFLSAFESLIGEPHAIDDWRQKMSFVVASSVFEARAMGGDRLARARFIVERMPVLDGRGFALGGALGAEALFGGPPRDLGERCLFAAAAGFPLWMPRDVAHERYRAARAARHERAQGRARACAAQLATSSEELAAALARIDVFENPSEVPPQLGASATPVVWDSLMASIGEIDSVERVLSLETAAQETAEPAIVAALDTIAPRLAPGLCFDGACEVRADHLVAVAEIQGDGLLLRVVATNRHRSLFGPVQRIDEHLQPMTPAFGLASQHKIIIGLVAARHEETALCNKRHGEIRNVSGPEPVDACDLGDDAGWVAAIEAMARSMNLPWIEVAVRHSEEVDTLERSLGLAGEPAGPAAAALGVGRRASPARFMALLAAIERGANGEPPRSRDPSLLVGQTGEVVDLDALGYGGDAVSRVAAWLEAPLAAPGTLVPLNEAVAAIGCVAKRGKSGTGETGEVDGVRSRQTLASIDCGGRQFIVFASLWSSHAGRHIGNVGARDTSALIAAALRGVGPQLGEDR